MIHISVLFILTFVSANAHSKCPAKRIDEGLIWRAYSFNEKNELVSGYFKLPKLSHQRVACIIHSREWNEHYKEHQSCAEGSFVMNVTSSRSEHYYKCPFPKARLFVAIKGIKSAVSNIKEGNGKHVLFNFVDGLEMLHRAHFKIENYSISTAFLYDDHKLKISSVKTEPIALEDYRDFMHTVTGLYCIIPTERDAKPKKPEIGDRTSYPKSIPSDLRVPRAERSDVFLAKNCDECYSNQICSLSGTAEHPVECSCPDSKLLIYPFQNNDIPITVVCQNTRLLIQQFDVLTVESLKRPMRHHPEACANAQFVKDGSFSCFAGEFGRHPVYQLTYTCDFGEGSGHLYIHSWEELRDELCLDDRTERLETGVKSYVPGLDLAISEQKERGVVNYVDSKVYRSAYHNSNPNGRKSCIVTGFYCLRKNPDTCHNTEEGVNWMVYAYNLDEFGTRTYELNRIRLQKLTHQKLKCQLYVREYMERRLYAGYPEAWKCVEGVFKKNEDNSFEYECPVQNGRFFVAAEDTQSAESMARHSATENGTITFNLHDGLVFPTRRRTIVLSETEKVTYLTYENNSLVISGDPQEPATLTHRVEGFYCIEVESEQIHQQLAVTEVSATGTKVEYPENLRADLRISRSERADVFYAKRCSECFDTQNCTVIHSKLVECACPDYALDIFPNHSEDGSFKIRCKHTHYFVQSKEADGNGIRKLRTARPLNLSHKKEECEKYIKLNSGHSCFEGEFGRDPVYKGIYSCDFGESKGHLFYTWYNKGSSTTEGGTTYRSHSGLKSFVIAFEVSKEKMDSQAIDKESIPSFYFDNNKIALGQEKYLTGFYCIKK